MIDLGPEGGNAGGRIIVAGTPGQVAQTPGSYTGDYLTRVNSVTTEFLERTNPNNLQRIGIVNKIVGQALASGGVGSPEKRPVLEVRDAA